MKRYLHLLVCIVITLTLLSGCGNYGSSNSTKGTENNAKSDTTTDWEPTTYETVNNFAGVTMTVKEGTVSPAGLTVVLENNSDNRCIYGEYFLLEKKINDGWYQVPVAIDGNYGFDDIGYELLSEGDGEWKVDWDWLYGSLNAGEYRIVKDILSFRGTGDYDKYYLAAGFTIY